MDVDEYNRRGFYYETAVDTIGQAAENAEDFVYTQQIQKYYNPTIVVDNSDVLADILEDSYGNVEIVIDNGYPTFTSIYTGSYGWAPTYYNWCIRPSWTWNYAWGPVSWSWTWGPSWSWGWGYGPSWAYYPAWGPTWGPGWGPSWGYYPPRPPHPHHHHGYYSYNRPGAGRPYAPNAGWSHNTRPGGNYNGVAARPGSRPTRSPQATGRPVTNTNRNNGHRQRQTTTVNRNNTPVNGTRVGNGKRTMQSSKDISGQRVTNSVTNTPTLRTDKGTSVKNNRTTTVNKTNTTTARRRTTTTTSTDNRSYNTTTNRSNRSYNTTNNRSNRNYNTTNNRSNSSNRSYNSGTARHSSGSYRSGGSRGGGGSHHGGGHRGGRR